MTVVRSPARFEMTKPAASRVAHCPDCGGILQPVALERLTSLEVAASEAADGAGYVRVQCLLCGYEEDRHVDLSGEPAMPA
jgi:hypothetical protein